MKLTPEEIRQRAREIATRMPLRAIESTEAQIIQLYEEATGEKIPPPFDESKVKHLSVWTDGVIKTILVEDGRGRDTDRIYALVAECGGFIGSSYGWEPKSLKEWQSFLPRNGYRYAGNYNLKAGLPTP